MRTRVIVTERNGTVTGKVAIVRQEWHNVAVFTLNRDEWLHFASLCNLHEVEIVHETVSSDQPVAAAAE